MLLGGWDDFKSTVKNVRIFRTWVQLPSGIYAWNGAEYELMTQNKFHKSAKQNNADPMRGKNCNHRIVFFLPWVGKVSNLPTNLICVVFILLRPFSGLLWRLLLSSLYSKNIVIFKGSVGHLILQKMEGYQDHEIILTHMLQKENISVCKTAY